MATLYQLKETGLTLVLSDVSEDDAGKHVYEYCEEDETTWYLLASGSRIMFYASLPGGYSWESAEDIRETT